MFTGIVTDIGIVERVEALADTRVVIRTSYDTSTIDLGASISCSGVCLTVIDKGPELVRGRHIRRDDLAAPRKANGPKGAGSTWSAR